MTTRSICSSIFCIVWLLLLLPRSGLADMAAAAEAYDQGRYIEAARHWQSHAKAGETVAQMGLAQLYQHGLGVEANPGLAVYWYRRAARNGDPVGQLTLGDLLRDGFAGPPNHPAAWAWFRLAGHHTAQGDRARQQLETQMSAQDRTAAELIYRNLLAELP